MRSITSLNTVKIYYPFLWDRNSESCTSLMSNNHKKYIAYFSLFADQIIIPPRDLLGNLNAKINLKYLAKDTIGKLFIENEFLITTSGKVGARDFKDVCELYGEHALINTSPAIDMATYLRNENVQRQSYARYFIKELKNRGVIKGSGIDEFVSRYPTHSEVRQFIHTLDYPDNIKNMLNMQANYAYHYGGAVGNNAIVPPYSRQDKPPAYNPFYYFYFIEKFGERLEKKIGLPLDSNPYLVTELSRELSHFKKAYHVFSLQYLSLAEEVERLLQRKDISRNLYFSIVAALTDTFLSTIWSMFNILPTKLGIKYLGEFFYTYISNKFRPSEYLVEKLWSILKKYSPMVSVKYDLITLLNDFDRAIVCANKSIHRT